MVLFRMRLQLPERRKAEFGQAVKLLFEIQYLGNTKSYRGEF